MKLNQICVIDHSVVKDSLSYLRDKHTGLAEFRFHSDRVCRWLFAEAIRDLPLKIKTIETPLTKTQAESMDGNIVVMPILRAGLAMLTGALQAIPTARVGFVGLKRDEETAVAHEYYWNVPETDKQTTLIITDPMLATGGSAYHVLKRVAELDYVSIRLVCVVAAPEGIKKVQGEFPEVKIFTAAVDQGLNDKAYIVPGLGDYGDRWAGS